LTSFHWTLPKNVDGFELVIPKLRENTLFYMGKKFLETFVKFWTSWQWQSLFLIDWHTSSHWKLPNILMDFNWTYQNWGKHFILYVNRFLQVFLKFQTSWQWYYYYGKHYRNHCFPFVWQASTELCPNILMDFNWTYQNWGKHFILYVNRFLQVFLKFQTSWQW